MHPTHGGPPCSTHLSSMRATYMSASAHRISSLEPEWMPCVVSRVGKVRLGQGSSHTGHPRSRTQHMPKQPSTHIALTNGTQHVDRLAQSITPLEVVVVEDAGDACKWDVTMTYAVMEVELELPWQHHRRMHTVPGSPGWVRM